MSSIHTISAVDVGVDLEVGVLEDVLDRQGQALEMPVFRIGNRDLRRRYESVQAVAGSGHRSPFMMDGARIV